MRLPFCNNTQHKITHTHSHNRESVPNTASWPLLVAQDWRPLASSLTAPRRAAFATSQRPAYLSYSSVLCIQMCQEQTSSVSSSWERRKRQMRLRAGTLKVAVILWTRLTKEQAQRRAASTAGMVTVIVEWRHL